MALIPTRTVPKHPDTPAPITGPTNQTRVASLDVLRAITMVLMIFVNDLWSLRDIPAWLGHVAPGVDGMGLADAVFPAFLFIVGMSIPFSLASRQARGDRPAGQIQHIGSRTLALLTMGLFLVNGEYLDVAATGLPRLAWYALAGIAFILIWNTYSTHKPQIIRALRVSGVVILLTLAFIYRGGEAGSSHYFSIYWWGILGLIGWSYLASALITVFAHQRYAIIGAAWLLFCALSMAASAKILPDGRFWQLVPSPVMGGTLVAITLGGVLTTGLFQYFLRQNASTKILLVFPTIALGLFLLGLSTRPYWGLAKLGATPAWLFICSAFTILAFTGIYWLADVRGKAHWFRVIKPAGTDTLLCYLIPYFAYALVSLFGIHWPAVLLTGTIGLLKSFGFALLCVWVAGWLNRHGIRLKL